MFKVLVALLGLSQPVDDIPTIVVTPPAHTTTGMRQQASTFMDAYFRHFSGPDVLDQFARDYASHIDYYGNVVGREVVMHEKTRFVQRWPQRNYRPRPESIKTLCDEEDGDKLCLVTGLVDFACESPERHATSQGVARFRAAIWFGSDGPQIVGESSEVIG